MQPETKNCQKLQKDSIIEPDDFGFYEKMKVPPPTWCRNADSEGLYGATNEVCIIGNASFAERKLFPCILQILLSLCIAMNAGGAMAGIPLIRKKL